MANPNDKKSLLIILSVFVLVIALTYLISILARGYQIDFQNGPGLKATGLLSATSKPKSASVYINDRLLTATDDTINLPPGDYNIKITKDGYLPWGKDIKIKKEVVYQTDTNLFKSVPDLKSLTLTGAIHPSLSSDSSSIIYAVASASAAKDNGLYLIQLTDNPLPISRNIPRQLAPNFPGVDWALFTFEFSPNSHSVLATDAAANITYLLNLDSPITTQNLFDVTPRLTLIKQDWAVQSAQLLTIKLDRLPRELQPLVSTASADDVTFSSDDSRVLYLATADGVLKDHIISAPPAQSTQKQTRSLTKGNFYVYDIKDDTNFLIGHTRNPFWLPNSNSIVYTDNQTIKVMEYDGTNTQTLYAGNFNPDIVYPWADGSRIIILTSAYTSAPQNLYAVIIR